MAFPQLTGQTIHTAPSNAGPAVFVSVLALAAVMGLVAWRFIPHTTVASRAPAVTAAVPSVRQFPNVMDTMDQQLHLTHAEQELVTAAEQLNTARRLLAGLSPDLNRSYLQYEKRQADRAWTACDHAQRAIEEAREHIKVITSTGKDR
jgi:hypothetical protein